MAKLFKNYKNMSEYNSDKISISTDNLTYVQNGSVYTSETPEGITTYNTICFLNDEGKIYKNNKEYGGSSGEITEAPSVKVVNALPDNPEANTIYYVIG